MARRLRGRKAFRRRIVGNNFDRAQMARSWTSECNVVTSLCDPASAIYRALHAEWMRENRCSIRQRWPSQWLGRKMERSS